MKILKTLKYNKEAIELILNNSCIKHEHRDDLTIHTTYFLSLLLIAKENFVLLNLFEPQHTFSSQ